MTVIDPQTFLPGTYCSVPCYLLSNGTVQPLYHGPGSGMFDLAQYYGTQYNAFIIVLAWTLLLLSLL